MLARDFRASARVALKGGYGKSLAVYLIYTLITGAASYLVNLIFGTLLGVGNLVGNLLTDSLYGYYDYYNYSYLLRQMLLSYAVQILSSVLLLLLTGPLALGLTHFFLQLVKKDGPANFELLFSKFSMFGRAFMLYFLIGLKTFLWSLLFIVPGIIAGYRYCLAPYLMAQDPNLTPTDAIEKSKELMDGHKGRKFCLDISFIGWILLSILTCGIGAFFLSPYTLTASAVFYLERTGQIAPIGGGPGSYFSYQPWPPSPYWPGGMGAPGAPGQPTQWTAPPQGTPPYGNLPPAGGQNMPPSGPGAPPPQGYGAPGYGAQPTQPNWPQQPPQGYAQPTVTPGAPGYTGAPGYPQAPGYPGAPPAAGGPAAPPYAPPVAPAPPAAPTQAPTAAPSPQAAPPAPSVSAPVRELEPTVYLSPGEDAAPLAPPAPLDDPVPGEQPVDAPPTPDQPVAESFVLTADSGAPSVSSLSDLIDAAAPAENPAEPAKEDDTGNSDGATGTPGEDQP